MSLKVLQHPQKCDATTCGSIHEIKQVIPICKIMEEVQKIPF